MGAEGHGQRLIDPHPGGVGGFPLTLAHIEMVGARRAAPVDRIGSIAAFEMAKLPEGLARPAPPASMDAMRDSVGNPAGGDEKRRHARGQRMRMGLQFMDR